MSILIIQTGGTIDKIYPKSINGWGFEIGDAAVHRILSKKELSVDYRIISACKKDSTQLNENDRKNMLNICQKSSEEQIIITHGTDTILDTAKFLSIIENKTIVLTGSFLPHAFKNSDAEFNIGMAISAVQTLNSGIYVSLNGIIASHNELQRDDSGKYQT